MKRQNEIEVVRKPLVKSGYLARDRDEPNHKYIFVNSRIPKAEQKTTIDYFLKKIAG